MEVDPFLGHCQSVGILLSSALHDDDDEGRKKRSIESIVLSSQPTALFDLTTAVDAICLQIDLSGDFLQDTCLFACVDMKTIKDMRMIRLNR